MSTSALVAIATPARADDPVPMTTYTVVAGDDCPVVAKKVFGDRARTDLVHKYNPQLGPPPHHLVPGQTLNIPAPTPDARMMFTKNKVEVEAESVRPAKPDDLLYHGNRVSTGAGSSAGIDFHDSSQLFLSEDTLLVIYGDAHQSQNSIQTTLLNGNLRAHLSALAGRELATPSGTVDLGAGDVQVSIDGQKTTRLAVYKGSSTMTASKKKIAVAAGYGSKAVTGTPPTPPRLLPGAPTWTSAPPPVLIAPSEQGSLVATYADNPVPSGPKAEKWHVQVARDDQFRDTVVDTKVPVAIAKLQADGLPVGRYFVRVSGIDFDAFEGPFGQIATSVVISAKSSDVVKHRRTTTLTAADGGKGLSCMLDGAHLPIPNASIATTTERDHRIECRVANDVHLSGDITLPAATIGVTAEHATLEGDRAAPTSLTFDLAVGSGPFPNADALRIVGSPGTKLGPVASTATPGHYRVALLTRPPPVFEFRVLVDGVETSNNVMVQMIVPYTASEPAIRATADRFFRGGFNGHALKGLMYGPVLSAGIAARVGAFDLGAELRFAGEKQVDNGPEAHQFASEIALSVGVPLAHGWTPYVLVAPTVVSVETDAANAALVGGIAGVGMRLQVTRNLSLFAEPAYRITGIAQRADGELNPQGVMASGGLRADLF